MDNKYLLEMKRECILSVLASYKRVNAGHIGASLSCLDILIYLFFHEMERKDRFILSKGHAALALYTVLAKSGRIDPKLLDDYYSDGTILAAHPPCNNLIEDIPFGTGSLGHGLSLACGMAFAQRFHGIARRVFCVISEGDLNEGSTWESVLFAAHHKLENLVVFVDHNRLQGFGSSDEVLSLGDLEEKFRAFNFDVVIAKDGNSFESIHEAYTRSTEKSGRPKCIVANTTKGNGVSYMENKMEWHYLPMSDDQYQQALAELDSSNA